MRGVFLGGTGRSGTTILRQTLAKHPQVAAMPGELRIITDPNGILDTYHTLTHDWDPYKANYAIHHLLGLLRHVTSMTTSEYRQHDTDRWVGGYEWYMNRIQQLEDELTIGKAKARWTGASPESDFMYETQWADVADIFKSFVVDLFKRRNRDAVVFVEDTPYNSCHWEQLRQVFGQKTSYPANATVRFISCVRHPRDIYSSFLHGGKHWTPKDPYLAAQRISETLRKALSPSLPCGVFVCKLESLVEHPVSTLEQICDHIGIDSSYSLQICGAIDRKRAHIGRAKEELSEAEEFVYRDVLRWSERALGYG